ncbi:MAG: hypothetical protein GVY09_15260 [Gammaproteobacteria bacterium]|nr:hypothetical protein [Gammaproteobacteria bacterium]
MTDDTITLQIKYPWTMMPLKNAGEWIDAISRSLQPTDPFYGKQLFVSALHELEPLLLVDNDTDGNYAIISYHTTGELGPAHFETVAVLNSRASVADRLREDHERAVRQAQYN